MVITLAYYIWDSSQQQRNSFRMKLAGTFIGRSTFPQVPYGVLDLETARVLKTKVRCARVCF